MTKKVVLRRLSTGVPGLDEVLGGGLTEFSFNLIAGAPGSGKTTLAQHIMFSLADAARPALYFTVLGEPAVKMLRYQQQFTFFDVAKVNDAIRFVNLAKEVVEGGLSEILKRIVQEVEATSPGIVVVDSFRTAMRASEREGAGALDVPHFVQQLGMHLTGWEATTFLVGEYVREETEENPVFTVADGLLWLYQTTDRNSVVRKMQVLKSRGQAPIPGLHTFRITDDGVHVFPRVILQSKASHGTVLGHQPHERLSTGNRTLDEMLGGGIPAGYSVLVTGPSGSGKTVLATEFIAEGARRGEAGIVAVFEKRPSDYSRIGSREVVTQLADNPLVGFIHSRPLDLSIDETLYEVSKAIQRLNAKRLVIDSLSGFELALAPTFREDFRESLYRMVAVLTEMGVTMMMTAELEDSYVDLRFSPHGTAFLTDAIIMQRYVEMAGRLHRLIGVVKVRGSAHDTDLRPFDITDEGIIIGEPLTSHDGLLTGHAVPTTTTKVR
jgi:circadian clock protein KaiC